MSPRYGFLKILIDKRKKVIINSETRLSEEILLYDKVAI